jgi:hypothetical protein
VQLLAWTCSFIDKSHRLGLFPDTSSFSQQDIMDDTAATVNEAPMVNVSLDEFACDWCPNYLDDVGHKYHGRAWQLIAKAIKEQSLRLLGEEPDLRRLTAYMVDRPRANEHKPGFYTPSVHDLVWFGVLEM